MLQQSIWHIAKYQDNKNHPKFVQTAKYRKRSFSPSSGIYNLKPVVLFTNYMKKCMDIEKLAAFRLRGPTHFSLEKCR